MQRDKVLGMWTCDVRVLGSQKFLFGDTELCYGHGNLIDIEKEQNLKDLTLARGNKITWTQPEVPSNSFIFTLHTVILLKY